MKEPYYLYKLMHDDKVLLCIPLYQRRYSWKTEHCERLYKDLIRINEQKLHSHFFGSIVYKTEDAEDDLWIIDGQQRITTISLIVLAAINAVRNGVMCCDDDGYVERTKNNFLLSRDKRKSERKIKLCPIEEDREAYDRLFDNDPSQFVPAGKSMITNNYLIFYDLIEKSNISFYDLIYAIERLIIIEIRLDSHDNPQLIFESLNSCGKDLEEADKVRNYMLMSESPKVQREYYHNYWHKIEENTNNEPTMFIRDYLTIKKRSICKLENLYFDFKQYHEDENISRKELLADMLKFSKYYKAVDKACTGKKKVDRKLRQLASIESNICMPFYMSFLDYATENTLSPDLQYEVLDAIENYWARRTICNYPANSLSKTFALLHSDIMRVYEQWESRGMKLDVSYAEILKYILLKKQGTGAFPDDNEVREEFPMRKVYKVHPNYRTFLFERMENGNGKEFDDSLVYKIKQGDYTIEHIMPQTLNEAWKEALGERYEEIHQRYLHTFGNLTLTGYNSEYGNKLYSEKRLGYTKRYNNKEIHVNGFVDSHFTLSDYMRTHTEWTEKEIIERGSILLNRFLSIWPMIESAYKPLEKESDIVSIDDDDIDFKGRKVMGYRYNGSYIATESWKEMLVSVCKTLFSTYRSEMILMASKNEWLFDKPNHYRSKIEEQCYVLTSCDTKLKISSLRHLLNELGIPLSHLEIALQQKSNNEEDLFDYE